MLGAAVVGFGLGLLIATCFESAFFCCCIGVVFLGIGGLLFVRK